MKILFQDELEQLKKIRPIVRTMEEAEKLAVCLNHWSDDDSWGGSFRYNEIIAEPLYEDWFVNMKMLEQLVVDEDGITQGYISFDNHGTDDDAGYVPLLGVCPTAQGKGYGKALLLSILKKSIELGKRRLELDTWAGNLRSVPVYKKTGFFWRKNTSATMENYLPAVLTTPYFEEFFAKNDFYDSREFEVTQKEDDFTHKTMQAYYYRFIEDETNKLTVYVDCHAKDLSGFTYSKEGQKLSLQLIPNHHEIFLGLDNTEAELLITNKGNDPVHIRGKIAGDKGIKALSPSEIDFIVGPDEEKSLKITVSVDLTAETYVPTQRPRKRTKCRISTLLEINGKSCQLGCGWVPKEVFQITILNESLYFGKNTKEVLVPIGFRNLTQIPISGDLSITGEGLSGKILLDFNLEAESAMEESITIQKPFRNVAESWEWEFEFKVKRESGKTVLPLIKSHISCFTKSGVVGYINSKPKREAVIENEFIRFHFSRDQTRWYSLHRVFVKDMDLDQDLSTFGISVGRPFPVASSEFISMISPFQIIQGENSIALKQEFLSKIEKPGLKVVRWIELDAGQKYVTTYYELTNTLIEETQVLNNVSVRNMFWRWGSITGAVILPGKQGITVIDDPEFIDEYDFPKNPEDYIEPWIACEPYNVQKLGFGVIWNPPEADRILVAPHLGPNIESIPYNLKSGQTIRTGHYTLVIGNPIVRLTRKIWLEEFNGKATINKEKFHMKWSQKLMDFDIGQNIFLPDSDQSLFPSISMIDIDSKLIEFKAHYRAQRKTPINLEISLLGKLWPVSQNFKLKLEEGKLTKRSLPFNTIENNQEPYIIPIEGTISLPSNIRNHNWITVPYHSKSQITLEKSDDHWIFSNNLLNFKTSNSHGASLFSASVGDSEELFFSRFPNKEAYVWFEYFVGGFSPIAFIPETNLETPFFNNQWTAPLLIKNNEWTGLQFSLASAINDIRLKNISYTMTYYMRPKSPLLWANFSFINNSKMTSTIRAGLNLFLQPIKYITHPWNNDHYVGKHTGQERHVYTLNPHNWVKIDWGKDRIKALIASANPQISIRGEYSNQNKYSEFFSYGTFTLAPGESKNHNLILVFSKNLEEFKTFQQKQQVVKL